ncbi:protease SohB [Motiliproteus sp. MSK22-1]|uniref:protease SohB n=1 Tax=Motiliproteus sp. MSK22-1 TaxID=1897630 RepID=UPI001E3E76EC|nr:protease SohB [Motiliproteus sp. MSK22-1]
MLEFFAEYGLFLAKAVTIVIAIIVVIGAAVQLGAKNKGESDGHIEVKHLNVELDEMTDSLKEAIVDKALLKKERKDEKKKAKAEAKANAKQVKKGVDLEKEHKKRVFVLDFDGDIKASDVEPMREEITAILTMATEQDEIMLRLESGGGMVHSYGLASSQLLRIKDRKIPLIISVDRVAASGGYMMACLADKLIAAPFAVLGSIGVVAQIPNFHRLLKKHDVDIEMLTAGEYKRTLTMFGENTDKDREKFVEDLEDTHELFKEFVAEHRPKVNIEEVANGEVWFGRRAMDKALIDEISTSDEYLLNACNEGDVYHISYVERKSLPERFGLSVSASVDRLLLTWWDRIQKTRYFS